MKKVTVTLILLAFAGICQAQHIDSTITFFSSGKYSLSGTEKQKLLSYVNKIDSNSLMRIEIHAFCDDVGNATYNKQLSEKRAKYIKKLLIDLHINPKKIRKSIGRNEIKIDSSLNDFNKQRSNNRRALIKFYYAKIIIIKDLKVGDKIELGGVLFQGGRHALIPSSFRQLNKLVISLKENPEYNFIVQGHVCCHGPDTDGKDNDTGLINLSEARAKIVYKFLIKHGISPRRLSYEGLKADYPTGKSKRFDRRVELKVLASSSVKSKKT